MLSSKSDEAKMMNYYRTSEMLNLKHFFPEVSPIKEIIIVENPEEFLENKEYFERFDQNDVDTIKGRPPITGIQNRGKSDQFYSTLLEVKQKDENGVLVLFNIDVTPSERYERWAGINVNINVGDNVIIEAVSKGFDGMEVSHGICTHERYLIPWYKLRSINIDNFKEYQIFKISQEDYDVTRKNRIEFLKSIGLDEKKFISYIPEIYQNIPDFIWSDIIKNVLKKLEKQEDYFLSCGYKTFVLSGHTEGEKFAPWKMFDKNRHQ